MVIHIESKVCGLVYISFKQENVLWLLVNVNQKCCWLYILSLTVNPFDIIVKGVNDSHIEVLSPISPLFVYDVKICLIYCNNHRSANH